MTQPQHRCDLHRIGRRTFLGLTAGALTTAVSAGQQATAPASQPTPPSAPAPGAFRAMTYNIHHGEGVDGRLDLERIAAVIREHDA